MFVRKYAFLFETTADICSADMNMTTKCRNELRIPEYSTTCFQRGTHYNAVKECLTLSTDKKYSEFAGI